MLAHLSVKNVALIDELKIEFGQGLNVLTGETGAGKSILVDSVVFALGGRVRKDLLRSGESSGFVELLFQTADAPQAAALLSDFGVDPEPDGTLLVSRSLAADGKTVSRVNGRTVTLGMLRAVTGSLIDVHGQHEHQSLLDPCAHLDLLDLFAGKKQKALLAEQAADHRRHLEIAREIEALSVDDMERARRADLVRFQVDEIDAAGLTEREEEELSARRLRLRHSEKIARATAEALLLLADAEGEAQGPPAAEAVRLALRSLRELSGIDPEVDRVGAELETVAVALDEATRTLRGVAGSVEHDPALLETIETRLDTIARLKRKHGDTVAKILARRDEAAAELLSLDRGDERIAELTRERETLESAMRKRCAELTRARTRAAAEAGTRIARALADLAMPNAKFEAQVSPLPRFTERGLDRVEFLISPNRGEPVKPLAKIASGGEMSRVMLALKSVLAEVDRIGALVFDEIDAGVSGEAAASVGEKLALVAGIRQVICVTHLPQIAAMGDRHFRIEKRERAGRTFTTVGPLPDDESLLELARLLSGARRTEAALENAREMKRLAEGTKRKLRKVGARG